MLTLTYDQVHYDSLALKDDLTAYASEIGLASGEWPDFIRILASEETTLNGTTLRTPGTLFQKGPTTNRGKEVNYYSIRGLALTVFNDLLELS